jgi:hypothetical protein
MLKSHVWSTEKTILPVKQNNSLFKKIFSCVKSFLGVEERAEKQCIDVSAI